MKDYCFKPHGPQTSSTDEPGGWMALLAFAAYMAALALCDLIDRSFQ